MSTNKTQNYSLHSWEPSDDFLRSEFNDNFTSLDATLKTLSDALAAETAAREAADTAEAQARSAADTAETQARTGAVSSLITEKAEIVCGAYLGNDATERIIPLGFQPKAVLVIQNYGRTYVNNSNSSAAYGGLCLPTCPVMASSNQGPIAAIEIVPTGFKVRSAGYCETNRRDETYCYLAIK